MGTKCSEIWNRSSVLIRTGTMVSCRSTRSCCSWYDTTENCLSCGRFYLFVRHVPPSVIAHVRSLQLFNRFDPDLVGWFPRKRRLINFSFYEKIPPWLFKGITDFISPVLVGSISASAFSFFGLPNPFLGVRPQKRIMHTSPLVVVLFMNRSS